MFSRFDFRMGTIVSSPEAAFIFVPPEEIGSESITFIISRALERICCTLCTLSRLSFTFD